MKIRIENNEVKVTVEIPNCVSDSATAKIAELVFQLITNIHNLKTENTVSTTKESIVKQQKEETEEKTLTVPVERPTIRNRIPNNIIDINDLSLKQAVTENTLVRCPHCGQAHAIIIRDGSGIYLMRKDYQKNEFVVIAEYSINDDSFIDACCKENTDRKAYFEDLQNFPESNEITQFNVVNDTELFCPVCHESNVFNLWKDAYENPLDFFETEHLCDACGGEVVEKIVKGKNIVHCEKCNLEQEVRHE